MALIPPSFLDCVVAIGVPSEGKTIWIGTGFIVGRLFKDSPKTNQYHAFVVTNKHVLKDKERIVIRFNKLIGTNTLDYEIELNDGDGQIWVGHASEYVDVASFIIDPNMLDKDDVEFSRFLLDKQVMTIKDMSAEGVSEGDGIFVLGFPMGMVSPQRLYAITRKGSIARIRDVIDGEQVNYMIDALIFPGNSGGPVVIHPQFTYVENTKPIQRAALIGIVKAYLPFEDVAISQQTNRPRVTFEENSGLAIVETVDSIIETVEMCFDEKMPR